MRVTPYGVNLGDGGQHSILHTLMVYIKLMIVFLVYLTKLETSYFLNLKDIVINDWMVDRNIDENKVRRGNVINKMAYYRCLHTRIARKHYFLLTSNWIYMFLVWAMQLNHKKSYSENCVLKTMISGIPSGVKSWWRRSTTVFSCFIQRYVLCRVVHYFVVIR